MASFFDTRARLKPIRDKVESYGHKVVGRWIDEQDTVIGLTVKEQADAACRDLVDIMNADLFILDTIDENKRGGREVEFGYAYAFGRRMWVVGPGRNIFHTLAGNHFATWEDCLHALYLADPPRET
jgi:hypothetical protein